MEVSERLVHDVENISIASRFAQKIDLKMNNKFLKLIVFTGNVLCVYRSYYTFSCVRRCIAWVRILIELAVILAGMASNVEYLDENRTRLTYLFLTLISSFGIVFSACYHGKDFNNLTKLIEKNHAFFIKDKEYCGNIDRRYKHIIVVMIAYPFLSLSLIISYHIMYSASLREYKYMLFSLNALICDARYIFEYITLYSFLFILSEQLNCITRSIWKERLANLIESKQVSVPNYINASGSVKSDDIQEITSFEHWTAFYNMNIKEYSCLINTIFGIEITIVLATVVFYLILCLYAIACLSINGSFAPSAPFELFTYAIKTLYFLIAIYMLARSAQNVQNSVDQLKRCLGRLLIHSTENLVCYKETKDLLRLITSRPIRTQAFGSINIDMSLIPKFVMFFTSYTVIALQFNNVV